MCVGGCMRVGVWVCVGVGVWVGGCACVPLCFCGIGAAPGPALSH